MYVEDLHNLSESVQLTGTQWVRKFLLTQGEKEMFDHQDNISHLMEAVFLDFPLAEHDCHLIELSVI